MQDKVLFRKAKIQEADRICRFQLAMALETEGLHLDGSTCLKGVNAVFEDPRKGFYFVAEIDEQTVASLLIIPEWSDWRNGQVWWIHSVYVEPQHRNKGIFAGLYRYIQDQVRATENLRGLRLYVDRRNAGAQEVYRKLGMTNEHYELYEWMKTF